MREAGVLSLRPKATAASPSQTAGSWDFTFSIPTTSAVRHIANASYAVDSACRGEHIGEKLVSDCLAQAAKLHFRLLQFNAVVENNIHARHLYERLGFALLGTIPGGFRMKDGTYQNICLYYHEL